MLLQAARMGLVDLDAALYQFEASDLRHTPQFVEQLKRMGRERAGLKSSKGHEYCG